MKEKLILIVAASALLAPNALAQSSDPFAAPGKAQADPFGAASDVANDPFADNSKKKTRLPKVVPPQQDSGDLSVRYETFSLALADAAAMMRESMPDATLYGKLVDLLEKGTVTQETLTVLRLQSGQRSKNESISEYIYPTEWDPAEIPQIVGIKIDPPRSEDGAPLSLPDTEKLAEAPRVEDIPLFTTPATATAFETRNTGISFEADAHFDAPHGLIQLSVAPEHVGLVELLDWGQGVSEVRMPLFESQKISTTVSVAPGVPRLLGTINRPPGSKVDRDSAQRIWFAFVTSNLVK